ALGVVHRAALGMQPVARPVAPMPLAVQIRRSHPFGGRLRRVVDLGVAVLAAGDLDLGADDEITVETEPRGRPVFVPGVVQGVALGGGAGLVSSLDHVIGESETRIALSEGKLGILPAVIGPYVYQRIGSAQTRRLAMLACKIPVDEALRIGMIDQKVKSPEQFDKAISTIVKEVLTTGPIAVTEAKCLVQTIDRWESSDEELRSWTLDKTSEMRGSAEGQEGLSSFIERRAAAWKSED
ncbi:MAG: enoyl-CoA hydratase-related protein, partial [Candidatus Thalassarchaeaceae archaeon]|nr:enoyl-CoA hydratase-related protein [Candidatus Thalassarchaeaceae archaeon]